MSEPIVQNITFNPVGVKNVISSMKNIKVNVNSLAAEFKHVINVMDNVRMSSKAMADQTNSLSASLEKAKQSQTQHSSGIIESNEKLKSLVEQFREAEQVIKRFGAAQSKGFVVQQGSEEHQQLQNAINKYKELGGTLEYVERVYKGKNMTIAQVGVSYESQVEKIRRVERQLKELYSMKERGIKFNPQLQQQFSKLNKEYVRMGGNVKNLMGGHKDFLSVLTRYRWFLVNITMAYYGINRIIGPLIRSYLDLENQMANVRKTTGLSVGDISTLSNEFVRLSTIVPHSANELAQIAVTAGQLGIQGTENIRRFTTTVAVMATATMMSTEDASKALAKLSQAFNIPISYVNNLGSAINMLGNTTAATAAEIVSSTTRVGAAAANLGVSVQTVAALQATLIASGMEASRAGTRMRTALTSMSQNIEQFARIARMELGDFQNLMRTDMDTALLRVVEGLSQYNDKLQASRDISSAAGAAGAFAFLTLASSVDELRGSMDLANSEMEAGLSLVREQIIQAETTTNRFRILGDTLKGVFLDTEQSMGSATRESINFFSSVVDGFNFLIKGGQEVKGQFDWLYDEHMEPSFIEKTILSAPAMIKAIDSMQDEVLELAMISGYTGEQIDEMFRMINEAPTALRQYEVLTLLLDQVSGSMTQQLDVLRDNNRELGESSILYEENADAINKALQELREENKLTLDTMHLLRERNALATEHITLNRQQMVLYEQGNSIMERTIEIMEGMSVEGKALGDVLPQIFETSSIDAMSNSLERVIEEYDKYVEKLEAENRAAIKRGADVVPIPTFEEMHGISLDEARLRVWELEREELERVSLGFKELFMTEQQLEKLKIQQKYDEVAKSLKDVGLATEENIDALNQWRDAQIDIIKETFRTREEVERLNQELDNWSNKIKEVTAELNREKTVLSEYQAELRQINDTISELSSPRFTGQREIDILIQNLQRYTKEQELASHGIFDSEQFLQQVLNASSKGYAEVIDMVTRLNNVVDEGRDKYDAWRESIREATRQQIIEGRKLEANVSRQVDEYAHLYLQVSRFEDETKQTANMLSLLQMAYDVHYGGMQDEVQNAIDLHNDENRTIYDNTHDIISNLQKQWEEQDRVTNSIEQTQSRIEEQEAILQSYQDSYDGVRDSIDSVNKSLEEFIKNTNESVHALSELIRLQSATVMDYDKTTLPTEKRVGDIFPDDKTLSEWVNREAQSGDINIGNINVSSPTGNPKELAYQFAQEVKRELKTM